MAPPVISAEITAAAGCTDEAARRLQALGFRVRQVGATISVEAPKTLWEDVFHVAFRRRRRRRMREVAGTAVTVWEPTAEPVPVPKDLEGLVDAVAFAQPPELF
jgi:hypothetical protein